MYGINCYNENWGDYGLDKLKIEEFLMQGYKDSGFPAVMMRPTYIYGPGNELYREHFFFERIAQQEIVPIPNSECLTQYIYIEDLLKTFEELMIHPEVNGQAFNITHPEQITWEELVKTAANAMEMKAKIKRVDYQGKMHPREFFPFRDCTYLLDIDKLTQYHLSVPCIDLKEGLKRAYQGFLKDKRKIQDAKMCKVEEAIKLRDND